MRFRFGSERSSKRVHACSNGREAHETSGGILGLWRDLVAGARFRQRYLVDSGETLQTFIDPGEEN